LIISKKIKSSPFIPARVQFIVLFLLFYVSTSSAQLEAQLYLEGARVTDIKREGNSLWVATYGQGIYQYSLKDGKWTNYSSKSGNLDNDLFHCVAANKDFVWAGANEGLFIYSHKTKKWTKRKFAQGGEFGNWIRSLNYDEKRNRLWIGRFRNVTVFDVKSNKFTDYSRVINSDEKTNNFNNIVFDGDSVVWLGAEFGAHKFNAKKSLDDQSAWSYINNKGRNFNGEGNSVSVTDFVFEKNAVWFGTDEFITKELPEYNVGGIYVWDRKLKWERISKANGLGGNGIYCMARTGNYIWAGVYEFKKNDKEEYGKGLYLINRRTKKVTPIDLNELNITTSNILSLFFDGTHLWIGTSSGLVKLKLSNELAKIKK
jgi:ligand-binding sensor domain-containing protein